MNLNERPAAQQQYLSAHGCAEGRALESMHAWGPSRNISQREARRPRRDLTMGARRTTMMWMRRAGRVRGRRGRSGYCRLLTVYTIQYPYCRQRVTDCSPTVVRSHRAHQFQLTLPDTVDCTVLYSCRPPVHVRRCCAQMRMARAIFWSPLSDSKFLLTVVLAIARTST